MNRKIIIFNIDDLILDALNGESGHNLISTRIKPNTVTVVSRLSRLFDYEFLLYSDRITYREEARPDEKLVFYSLLRAVLESEGVNFSSVQEFVRGERSNDYGAPVNIEALKKLDLKLYDLSKSFFISSEEGTVSTAERLGLKPIIIDSAGDTDTEGPYCSWEGLFEYLASVNRGAEIVRNTNETEVTVKLGLNGSGNADVDTGIGFLDHMLHQLARHGGFDLLVKTRGDSHIDEHHTIEDTAITLGKAFDEALGDKRGIERYGFVLPMDDSLAQVAVDLSGRPWLVWDVEFKREKIGDFPTEMFIHFFKSFSDNAKCNLNIKAEGQNEHHKIESVFKAFSKALKMAVKISSSENIPSTKGLI